MTSWQQICDEVGNCNHPNENKQAQFSSTVESESKILVAKF